MQGQQKNIASTVQRAIEDAVGALGFAIWDVEYVKEGSEWYLRITIDREEGVDMNDCEQVIRRIDPIITDLDPIEDSYHLEVSSPGLERDLRTDAHFAYAVGKTVRARLFRPLDGQREIVGRLVSFGDGLLTFACGERELTVEKKQISKANVWFDFDSLEKDEGEMDE